MSTQDHDIEKGIAQAELDPSADDTSLKKVPILNNPGDLGGPNRIQDRDVEKEAGTQTEAPNTVNNTPKRELKRNNTGDPSGLNRPNPGAPEGTKSSDFDHPTSKIWAVYNSETAPFDKALIESWTKDMDGILIFAGLFSAVVSAFLIDGYQNLSQDSGDATVALLAHISLQLAAASNGSQVGPMSPPNDFQPTISTIAVNILWFISLILALICALTATLVQQWARDYQQTIEHRPAPHTKALIRSFLFEGVESFKMTAVVDGIPTLLHVAVLLFILGLIQFLFSINLVVAGAILSIFLLFVLLYFGVTVLPAIWAQCPYRTPFSAPVRYFTTWTMKVIYKILDRVYWATPNESLLEHWSEVWKNKLEAVTPAYNWTEFRESAAANLGSEPTKRRIDNALRWTLESLTTDSELEPFVAGLPALLSTSLDQTESQMVSDVMIAIILEPHGSMASRIAKLLHTCIPPTILFDQPRIKRATVCLQAIDAICHTRKLENDRLILHFVGLLEAGGFSSALSSFTRLGSHQELASSAEALTSFIAAKIETALHKGEELKMDAGVGVSAVLRISYGAGRFQLLPLLAKDGTGAYALLETLTDWLADYSWGNSKPSAERQSYMQECLKFINSRATSAYDPSFESFPLLESLVKLRDDKQLAISQCANCASASWAIHLQCSLLGGSYMSDVAEALCVFGTVLFENHHVIASVAVNGELSLGIRFRAEWEILKARWMLKTLPSLSEDPSSAVDSSAHYDRDRLDALLIVDVEEVGYWGRVVTSRGRTAILVIFLSSMKSFPPPDDTLELTLETLRLITASLTVSYSSASTQIALIRLVDRTSKQLRAHLMSQDKAANPLPDQGAQKDKGESNPVDVIEEIPLGPSDVGPSTSGADLSSTEKYILPILHALLDVVGTIAHPDSIEKAKQVVTTIRDEFTANKFPAVHNDAVDVLAKLDGKRRFAFNEKLLPTGSSSGPLGGQDNDA